MRYLGIAERWIETKEIFQEGDHITCILGEKEGQKHVVWGKRFNHDGKEHDSIADSIRTFESGSQGGDEVGQHLHGQSERIEQEEDDNIERCLSKETKTKG